MPPSTLSPALHLRARARAPWRPFARRGRLRAAQLAGRADELAGSFAGTPAAVVAGGVVSGAAGVAAPYADRVLRRRRPRRRRGATLLVLVAALLACAGVVAWLAWREPRDEEFAHLRQDPDAPDVAPAGSGGPVAEPAPAVPTQPAATSVPAPVGGASRPSVPVGDTATAGAAPAEVAPSDPVPRVRAFAHPSLPSPVVAPPFRVAGARLPLPGAGRPPLPS